MTVTSSVIVMLMPGEIVVSPALTVPAVTYTSAANPLSMCSASSVVNTSRTRSTSRTVAPGVKAMLPDPGAGEISVSEPPAGPSASATSDPSPP
jgi:hypothetical protein